MKTIEFNVKEMHGERYFRTSYCGFEHLSPSQSWSDRKLVCTKADGTKREIHIPEFTNLLDGRFQVDGKNFDRLELFHFDVDDKLTIELPDDTTFTFQSYCVELRTIGDSFDTNKKLDLIVTEYDGRHFFETVVGPQKFVLDEFAANPFFYYAGWINGRILRGENELCRFYSRDRGGMDCYHHYFANLSAEFATQTQQALRSKRDVIPASKLQIGDRIELRDSSAFALTLVREWTKKAHSFSSALKQAGINPRIPHESGCILLDYANQPQPQ